MNNCIDIVFLVVKVIGIGANAKAVGDHYGGVEFGGL